ncbi:hypothetical protein AVEN_259233-1 [Araneus ventricosus]|uniref:Uncharacterized protein n=1 Tax=Araneus ventricosus TaxID=182803 RepID=A0A4Y2IHB2_ARAVE|nr:hypothetical protein AVEN_259233-1 [Araneus ventricosus]
MNGSRGYSSGQETYNKIMKTRQMKRWGGRTEKKGERSGCDERRFLEKGVRRRGQGGVPGAEVFDHPFLDLPLSPYADRAEKYRRHRSGERDDNIWRFITES